MKYTALLVCTLISTSALANTETLIVGDSHVVGAFGENLHKIFRQKTKANTRTIGLAGGSPSNYVATSVKGRTLSYGFADRKNENERVVKGGSPGTVPEWGALLKETNPDRIIIELGDNFADYKGASAGADAFAAKQVGMMIAELKKQNSTATCYWVTPTWTDKSGGRPYKKTNERLLKVIEIIKKNAEPRCTVIDSAQGIGIGKGDIKTISDGLHFDGGNGKKWAEAAAKKIFEIESQKVKPDSQVPPLLKKSSAVQ